VLSANMLNAGACERTVEPMSAARTRGVLPSTNTSSVYAHSASNATAHMTLTILQRAMARPAGRVRCAWYTSDRRVAFDVSEERE
jgi:hypothetical protein